MRKTFFWISGLGILLPVIFIFSKSMPSGHLLVCSSEHKVIFHINHQPSVVATFTTNIDLSENQKGTTLLAGKIEYIDAMQQITLKKPFSVSHDFHYSIKNGNVRTITDGFTLHLGTTATLDELVKYVQPTLDKQLQGIYKIMTLGTNVYALSASDFPRTRCVNTQKPLSRIQIH